MKVKHQNSGLQKNKLLLNSVVTSLEKDYMEITLKQIYKSHTSIHNLSGSLKGTSLSN